LASALTSQVWKTNNYTLSLCPVTLTFAILDKFSSQAHVENLFANDAENLHLRG
jgi:hypothetical protein